MTDYYIGVDLGGTNIKIGCFDGEIKLIEKTSVPTGAEMGPEVVAERIVEQTKKLLDEFASKLSKVKAQEDHFDNGAGAREEGEGWNTDPEFQDLMFLNAPFVEDDSIVAEKGGWKNES